MDAATYDRLAVLDRHRARRLAVWNGAIWSFGNGLASTTLILYLARELRAERLGLHVGLILAAPHVIGLLQLGAPPLIGRLADRKRFCMATFAASALFVLAIPWLCAPERLPSAQWSLLALILLWCLHHLMQYLGMVGLWSWLADLSTLKARGRFLGWRNRWIVAAGASAAIVVGVFTWQWKSWGAGAELPAWMPYGILASLGAGFMLTALIPLARMPAVGSSWARPGSGSLKGLLRPFRDARFLRLLLYGCWFSFSNGISQSAQRIFAMNALGLTLFGSLALETGTRLGQSVVSPRLGRLADAVGNRRVMIVCQVLVAAGLLCYAVATPDQWAWLIVAALLWVAYAGLNVCLPNLMLKLSPRPWNTSYVATFEGVRGVSYAASTVLGGILVDRWGGGGSAGAALGLPFFAALFLGGWALRSLGAVLLLLVDETPAEDSY
ncbi:MAG: hypothetical protein ABFC63_01490 [Thermoguttaceae bacterium]